MFDEHHALGAAVAIHNVAVSFIQTRIELRRIDKAITLDRLHESANVVLLGILLPQHDLRQWNVLELQMFAVEVRSADFQSANPSRQDACATKTSRLR